VLSVTGCSATNLQATTIQYSPSDGVRTDIGKIELRNMIVVSNGKDAPGRIIGAVFNTSDKDSTVTFSGNNGSRTEIQVKPGTPYYLGADSDPSVLSSVSGLPGTLETMRITVDGGSPTDLQIPVLDATLKEYQQYIPSPSPSGTASSSAGASSATGSASDTASATATK
jgi:hypothetical protein